LNSIESISKLFDPRRRCSATGPWVTDLPSPPLPSATPHHAHPPALGYCRPGATPLSSGLDPPISPHDAFRRSVPPPTLPHRCSPLKGCHPSSPLLGPTLPLSYFEWTVSAPSNTPCIFSAADHRRVIASPVLKLSATITSATPRAPQVS
jgi:hypothetical protein